MRSLSLLILVLFLITSCGRNKQADSHKDQPGFESEFNDWQEKRTERLKSKNGWLNLAGLFWLEEGDNTIGSDSANSIIFPDGAPAFIGKFTLEEGIISFEVHPGTNIIMNGEPVIKTVIQTDRSGNVSMLETGSYAWFIIDRSPRFGIRLRDYDHPAIEEFHGIETYEPDPGWVIEAEFERYEEPRELLIPTVVGTVEKNLSPGVLKFEIGGNRQELHPSSAGKGLFLIFADESSGLETYGGGRFLYIDSIGEGNRVKIDFNRAYNPPCAFTPFATCPLPPRENFLTVSIEAGEKFSGH